jgi:hypothetical protein
MWFGVNSEKDITGEFVGITLHHIILGPLLLSFGLAEK